MALSASWSRVYREIFVVERALGRPGPVQPRVVTVIGEVAGERRRLVDVKGRLELDGKVMAEAEMIMYRTVA